MAKTPKVSFDHLTLVDTHPSEPTYADASTQSSEHMQPEARAEESLKEASAHVMSYISYEAYTALAQYALASSRKGHKVRVHDLQIEAFAEWFAKRGINVEVRAKPRRTRK